MTRRILYVGWSLRLGHVTQDLAVAREMRNLCPEIDFAWLAGKLASAVLVVGSERFVSEHAQFHCGTDLAEQVSHSGRLDLVTYVLRALAGQFF